ERGEGRFALRMRCEPGWGRDAKSTRRDCCSAEPPTPDPSPPLARARVGRGARGLAATFTLPCPRSIAFRALHALGDPLLGLDARRRIHAFGRIAHDVGDLRLLRLLVVVIGAVGGLADALMAVAERQLYVP